MENVSILQIKNLCVDYCTPKGSINVLNNISLDITKGEFVSILGPNGSGKSTFIGSIAGHIKPTSGVVAINGLETSKPGMDRPIVLQDYGLFNWMTVYDNIAFPLKNLRVEKKTVKTRVKEIIELFELDGFEHHYPFELSGGMKQKAAIARAFIIDSDILLLDEPFANLDISVKNKLYTIVSEFAATRSKTVIHVTHNVDEAIFLSDRIIEFTQGPAEISRIIKVEQGRPRGSEFRSSEYFKKLKIDIIKNYEGEI
ncbi:MAG: ABC transporter ATP-binding protein [Ignavibacteriales bacterium]